MYRATGHVNTHKGMIFTLGIFSAAAGRCIQEDGTVTLQSILRMEQKMTARILRAEIEMLGKEPRKVTVRKISYNTGLQGFAGKRLPDTHLFFILRFRYWRMDFCGEWSGTGSNYRSFLH